MPRTQRYKLTHEFVLRDRGDYAYARKLFMQALEKVPQWLGQHNIQADYLAIEKVTDDE